MLLVGLACWLVANVLLWLTLSLDYLWTGSRLLYIPLFFSALAWASLACARQPTARSIFGLAVVVVVVVQSAVGLSALVRLYHQGSDLMEDILAALEGHGRALFVNVPDRFEYDPPLYPMGFWGMVLAPVSQELHDYLRLSTGLVRESASLSDLPLLQPMIEATPYRVSTRGVDAHNTALLYDTIEWADQTFWTDYRPDGAIELQAVGDIRPAAEAGARGRFANLVYLDRVETVVFESGIDLILHWRPINTADPADTVFVHLLDATGLLVAQADGEGLGGLLPPSAWRPGHEIEDRRRIPLDGPLPAGPYRLAVGIYSRVTGNRYPAFLADGTPAPDNALLIWDDLIAPANPAR
jgi:hypothetical protein